MELDRAGVDRVTRGKGSPGHWVFQNSLSTRRRCPPTSDPVSTGDATD